MSATRRVRMASCAVTADRACGPAPDGVISVGWDALGVWGACWGVLQAHGKCVESAHERPWRLVRCEEARARDLTLDWYVLYQVFLATCIGRGPRVLD